MEAGERSIGKEKEKEKGKGKGKGKGKEKVSVVEFACDPTKSSGLVEGLNFVSCFVSRASDSF